MDAQMDTTSPSAFDDLKKAYIDAIPAGDALKQQLKSHNKEQKARLNAIHAYMRENNIMSEDIGGVTFAGIIANTDCSIKSVKFEEEHATTNTPGDRDIFSLDDIMYIMKSGVKLEAPDLTVTDITYSSSDGLKVIQKNLSSVNIPEYTPGHTYIWINQETQTPYNANWTYSWSTLSDKTFLKKGCIYFLFTKTTIVLLFLSLITLPFNIFFVIYLLFIKPC